MAIVTRYFSTIAAGDEDGTSWTNRAALLDGSGNWSSVITGFNFSGTDNLLCYVQGGLTYSYTQNFSSAIFTNAPTVYNIPIFLECDSNGIELRSPAEQWIPTQPSFDRASMPLLSTATGAIATYSAWKGFNFLFTNRNGYSLYTTFLYDCYAENSTAGTSVILAQTAVCSKCVLKCSGASYNTVVSNTFVPWYISNCRIEGNPDATSGNRYGVLNANYQYTTIWGSSIMGNVGGGVVSTSTIASQTGSIFNCTIIDNPGSGVLLSSSAGQTALYSVNNCYIANNGAYGVDAQSSNVIVGNSRLRNNTTANVSASSAVALAGNNTAAGNDGDEMVNYNAGDYRIRASSPLWGKGYGAGDEIQARHRFYQRLRG